MPLELYPFRYRDERTGKWIRARIMLPARFLMLLIALHDPCAFAQEQSTQTPTTPEIKTEQASEGPEKGETSPTQPVPATQQPSTLETNRTPPHVNADDEKERGSEYWPPLLGVRLKITDSLLALFTFVLAVVTAGLWISTRTLARDAKRAAARQAREMGDAIRISREAADAAQKQVLLSRQALIHTDRAFVFITAVDCYWHLDPSIGKYWWSIHPKWENSGNTPTRGLRLSVSYSLSDTPLPDGFEFPGHPGTLPLLIGPKNTLIADEGRISGEDLVAVRDGRKFFYIWGSAKYHDIFDETPQHITKFCYYISGVLGHPESPGTDERITRVTFRTYRENNCSDEECVVLDRLSR